MSPIEILKTDLIYKNPKPHVRSLHGYFPSVVTMANGEMLASVVIGQAFESADLHTHLARSTDAGDTWTHEGPIYSPPKNRLLSDASRLTAAPDGEVVCFMVRSDRTDHPDEGLASHETMGFVPTELTILRSSDFGHTWSKPKPIKPPLVGPSFELCCPITLLRDGRWILPTQTWPAWNGDCPNGVRMIAFVSGDRGKTWPEYMQIFHEPDGKVYFWESKVVEFPDGKLLANAWVFDANVGKDRPNHYALSTDGGKTWTPPLSTGIQGQTMTPFIVGTAREPKVLAVYRRMDRPGLWATLAHLEGTRWVSDEHLPLWGADVTGLTGTNENMIKNFNVLRFGAPCITRSPDHHVFVAFWGYEDCVSVIRYFKLKVG